MPIDIAGLSEAPAPLPDIPAGSRLLDTSGWHPAPTELYRHWLSLCPSEQELPGRQHLDPAHFPHLLPHIWLLDVARDPMRFRYRLVGTRLDQVMGINITGRWMDEVHSQVEAACFERYHRMVESGLPSWRRGRPLIWYGKVAEIENVLLPLARDGRRVDMVLAQTRFYGSDGTEL
jgi:hypothetical protein